MGDFFVVGYTKLEVKGEVTQGIWSVVVFLDRDVAWVTVLFFLGELVSLKLEDQVLADGGDEQTRLWRTD